MARDPEKPGNKIPQKPEGIDFSKIPFFFILGRPRSGTTLLSTLFDAHPNVKLPPEFPIFLSLIQRFRKVKNWTPQLLDDFVDHIAENNVFNHRTLENLKIDKESLRQQLGTLPANAPLELLLKIFNASAFSLFPKEELLSIGDKNPVYSIYIKRLISAFPDARFVCITRDYRDNYISMKNLADLKLEAPVLTLQVARWRFAARLFLKYRKRFPDQFMLVRYEDLVNHPEETLKPICEFLGVPYHPEDFDFYKKKEETEATYPQQIVKRIHKNLMNPINKSRMGLWKKELTDRQVKTADVVAGKLADRFQYERKYVGFHPWTWLKTRPLVIYATLLFWLMQAGSFLPHKAATWMSVKLLVLVKMYHIFKGKRG